MRTITAALLLSFAAMNAHASTETRTNENRPYTFDYFVHVNSGPKPTLVFGTGQTTYIQLPEGVDAQQIQVRKGGTMKIAEVFYSAPYTVVKELHDSLKVVTNKGEFILERTGAKTEVELAAERAEAAQKERDAVQAKAKVQAAEIAKLRDEIKAQKDAAQAEKAAAEAAEKAAKSAAAETVAQAEKVSTGDAPMFPAAEKGRQKSEAPILLAMNEAVDPAVAHLSTKKARLSLDEAAASAALASKGPQKAANRMTFFIRNGEGLRSALAREAQKLGVSVSWSLREDRVASRDMTFVGDSRDAVLNDILMAFRLPGYLVESTNTLYIVKEEK